MPKNDEANPEKPGIAKTVRTRSPAYPVFGLGTGIHWAKILYGKIQDHMVPMQAIAEIWETNTKSSAFLQAISALKQFGLLDDEGKGQQRQARISSLAKTIILDSSPQGERAAKAAAINPKIHRELWEKYQGRLPTSDAPLRTHLLTRSEGAFNKDHVDDFIRQFRETIAFVKLTESDKILPAEENLEEGKIMERPVNTPPSPPKPPSLSTDGPFISFPLPGGNVIEIRLKEKISPKDFATVKKLVELSEASLVDSKKS
jgi:hypothetical protein